MGLGTRHWRCAPRAAALRGLGAALAVAAMLAGTGPAVAQSNPFRPVILVGDSAITAWELEQRTRILQLFRSPGDPAEEARRTLIDERLQLGAARRLGIVVPEEAVIAGMEEFAGRADLSLEEFLAALAQGGVAEETFRDFVRAGVSWREVVRTRFGPRAQVTEAEVDRALALTSRRGGAAATLSEIIIPAPTPAAQAEAEALAEEIARNPARFGGFAEAARRFSAAPTADAGGRVADPVPLGNLPPPLRAQVLTLAPGGISAPVPLGGAVGLFQLRGLSETGLAGAETVSVEFARYLIPDGGTQAAAQEAARIAGRVDACGDLYGVNLGQPAARLTIETRTAADLSGDLAAALARLDEGETATLLRDGTLVLLMLCGRTEIRDEEVDRAALRRRLIDQRLGALADGLLAELRADTIIRTP